MNNKFAETGLDSILVEKAVRAVLRYHEKYCSESSEKMILIGDERPVQIQFTLLTAPKQNKPKPYRIVIPHPFFKIKTGNDGNPDDDYQEYPEICLIVKESSKPWCQEMIKKFPDHMGYVKKVLTLESLRNKHVSCNQKQNLLSRYDLFMADDRILPMMSSALGKAFIKAKRLPIPINLARKTALPFAIQKALSATYMTINTGTCISIRTGHTGMKPEKIVENIMSIAKSAVSKVPRSWANVQVISIKTADSVSVPVYNKTPEALKEIAKMAGLSSNKGSDSVNDKGKDKKEKRKNDEIKSSSQNVGKDKSKELKISLLRALKKQKEEKEKSGLRRKKKKKSDNDIRADGIYNGSAKEESNESLKKDPKRKESKRFASSQPESISPAKRKKKDCSLEDSLLGQHSEPKTAEKKNFFPAKKFVGSKKGYVFQMGPVGLGYYVDHEPVVDKMKIEALIRMNEHKSGGGRRRKSKNKHNKGRCSF